VPGAQGKLDVTQGKLDGTQGKLDGTQGKSDVRRSALVVVLCRAHRVSRMGRRVGRM
jgi:hypothetical protein